VQTKRDAIGSDCESLFTNCTESSCGVISSPFLVKNDRWAPSAEGVRTSEAGYGSLVVFALDIAVVPRLPASLHSSAMDVAAFVFGALPGALYALDNYQRCLKPAKNYWKYDITLKQIQSHVYLQQEQLNATVACLGLMWNVSLRVRSSWEQQKCSCKVT